MASNGHEARQGKTRQVGHEASKYTTCLTRLVYHTRWSAWLMAHTRQPKALSPRLATRRGELRGCHLPHWYESLIYACGWQPTGWVRRTYSGNNGIQLEDKSLKFPLSPDLSCKYESWFEWGSTTRCHGLWPNPSILIIANTSDCGKCIITSPWYWRIIYIGHVCVSIN